MLAIALVVLTQLGPAGVSLTGPIFPGPKGVSRAAFEFAPLDGAGMGAACAGTTPTGAKGEAMSFARASAATCIKGNTTSLANGDMVVLSSGQPRVMPGGDGSGGLGLLVESARTNAAIRSEEFNNATWAKTGAGGASAPTVTADFAVAPTGATTADRIQVGAVTAGQVSIVRQAIGTVGAVNVASVYLKGNGTSGTLDLWSNGTSFLCSACVYNPTTWTRCVVAPAGNMIAAEWTLGNDASTCGVARPAQDVLVWGAQSEVGAFASSYIQTVSSSATRISDSTLTGTFAVTFGSDFSIASSVQFTSAAEATTALQAGLVAPNILKLGTSTNTAASYTISSTTTTPTVTSIGSTRRRSSLSDLSSARAAFWDNTVVTPPAVSLPGSIGASTDTAVTYSAGKIGQAATFNGTTSKIVTPVTGPLGAAPRTVSCWFKAAALDKWVVGYGGATSGTGFNLYLSPGGQVQFASWYAAPVAVLGTLTLGQWTHVAVTYDGTTVNGAVNGVAASPTALTLNTATTVNFVIGDGSDSHPFSGQIDEVAIWNRALSAGEIAQIYNAGAGLGWPLGASLSSGLIHYWGLDGNSNNRFTPMSIGAINAVTSSVCVDPDPSRCR